VAEQQFQRWSRLKVYSDVSKVYEKYVHAKMYYTGSKLSIHEVYKILRSPKRDV
jgi:hypothetical protein